MKIFENVIPKETAKDLDKPTITTDVINFDTAPPRSADMNVLRGGKEEGRACSSLET